MKIRHLLALAALLLLALGCGGGGTGGSVSSGALFMTDSLDSNTHVWVTVKKVVLLGASGNVTVFDDSAGATIDLKTLRDPAGERYSFLATARAGTYTGVTFTMDKTLVLFTSGSATGQSRVFAGNNGTTADLTLMFASARTIGPSNDLAVDFDLSSWDDDGTTISSSAFLRESSGVDLDNPGRHEHNSQHGTISDLTGTAPDLTFTLHEEHRTLTVMTNSETVIEEGATLQDGLRVKVKGMFSTVDNAFIADSVKVESEGDDDMPEVDGAVSNIVGLSGTFDIEVHEADNFCPHVDTVHVVTNGTTVFTDVHGSVVTSVEFFVALLAGDQLQVSGMFDSGTNTLTAVRVGFDDEDNGGGGGDTGGDTGGGTSTTTTTGGSTTTTTGGG